MLKHTFRRVLVCVCVEWVLEGEDPELVKGFLDAVAKGWKDAIATPDAAISALLKRNPAADAALETERLQMAIDANVLTDFVMENGMGSIDAARMASAIEQTKSVYAFQNEPDASLYFDSSFLPADGSLMLK